MGIEKSPGVDVTGMIQQALGKPLGPGELGVVLARAGVGKTACLTHIALEHLLHGASVLHVCINETAETIKIWYQEILKNISASGSPGFGESVGIRQQIESHRFILAYLNLTFSPEKLEQSFRNLKDQANFHPSMVILDGLDFDHISRSTLEELRDFAEHSETFLWTSARTHRHKEIVNERGIPYPCHEIDDLFQAILLLEHAGESIRLKVLKLNNHYQLEHFSISLDPHTFLLRKE